MSVLCLLERPTHLSARLPERRLSAHRRRSGGCVGHSPSGGSCLLTRDVRAAARVVAATARAQHTRDAGAASGVGAFGQPTAGGATARLLIAVEPDRAHALPAREAGLVGAVWPGRTRFGARCFACRGRRVGRAHLGCLVGVVGVFRRSLAAATASAGDEEPAKPPESAPVARGAYTSPPARVTSES